MIKKLPFCEGLIEIKQIHYGEKSILVINNIKIQNFTIKKFFMFTLLVNLTTMNKLFLITFTDLTTGE